jgi:hypothetical protein
VVQAPEGSIAARLGEIQASHPELEIGSYPFMNMDRPGTSVVFRGTDVAAIDKAATALLAFAAGVDLIVDDQGLA